MSFGDIVDMKGSTESESVKERQTRDRDAISDQCDESAPIDESACRLISSAVTSVQTETLYLSASFGESELTSGMGARKLDKKLDI